jgi:hypothetical protein
MMEMADILRELGTVPFCWKAGMKALSQFSGRDRLPHRDIQILVEKPFMRFLDS